MNYHRYPSGSSETIGVAGDIIWILISNPPFDTQVLWVGKFEK